ncbi:hypothetical protein P5673_010922 [Acropora cervicornis]|uniref:Uncharacterized protein n=1 Tax=Acropora cervicornis TaxID=6130 RepID=A0AAD9V928_ACRCE|nr:hypothetical protein P5673_010922 [Acropora cervicornis]
MISRRGLPGCNERETHSYVVNMFEERDMQGAGMSEERTMRLKRQRATEMFKFKENQQNKLNLGEIWQEFPSAFNSNFYPRKSKFSLKGIIQENSPLNHRHLGLKFLASKSMVAAITLFPDLVLCISTYSAK